MCFMRMAQGLDAQDEDAATRIGTIRATVILKVGYRWRTKLDWTKRC